MKWLQTLWNTNIKPRWHIWAFVGVAIVMLILIVEGVI